jgi:hypothetical protein
MRELVTLSQVDSEILAPVGGEYSPGSSVSLSIGAYTSGCDDDPGYDLDYICNDGDYNTEGGCATLNIVCNRIGTPAPSRDPTASPHRGTAGIVAGASPTSSIHGERGRKSPDVISRLPVSQPALSRGLNLGEGPSPGLGEGVALERTPPRDSAEWAKRHAVQCGWSPLCDSPKAMDDTIDTLIAAHAPDTIKRLQDRMSPASVTVSARCPI